VCRCSEAYAESRVDMRRRLHGSVLPCFRRHCWFPCHAVRTLQKQVFAAVLFIIDFNIQRCQLKNSVTKLSSPNKLIFSHFSSYIGERIWKIFFSRNYDAMASI